MARERDYAAEYARRTEGARTPEEREYARGHRGETAFERMLPGADRVRVYGNLTGDGRAFAVVERGGRRSTFRLYSGPPLDERRADAMRRRWEDQTGDVPDVVIAISP